MGEQPLKILSENLMFKWFTFLEKVLKKLLTAIQNQAAIKTEDKSFRTYLNELKDKILKRLGED